MGHPTLIIAEIGINHNGDPAVAREIILAAKLAKADVAKIHTYHAEDVMTVGTPLAAYMKEGLSRDDSSEDSDFLDMARRYELDDLSTRSLQAYCHELEMEFLSSPFDVPSVSYLQSLGVMRLKIPSGELVNPLLLRAAAETRLPLIVSTGMATLEEVHWAMETLTAAKSGPITLLHCLSQYPAEFCHVNLRAMQTLAMEFQLPVGYSDHTPGLEASIAAVAMGATVIEKHLTLGRSLPGPDQEASLTPTQFSDLVTTIRNVEIALGTGDKKPAPPEIENAAIVRKSLVLTRQVGRGERLDLSMLTAKRPGTGIPARMLDEILGRRLVRDVESNHILAMNDLKAAE